MIEVMNAVCRSGTKVLNYQVGPADIMSKSRKREIVTTRAVYSYMMKKFTKKTLASIGESINKDHSTVLSHLKTISNAIGNQKKEIDRIIKDCSEEVSSLITHENEKLDDEGTINMWGLFVSHGQEVVRARIIDVHNDCEARIKDIEAECQRKIDALTSAVKRHTSIDAGCPGFIREKLRADVAKVVG